jgi:hypothetical protein
VPTPTVQSSDDFARANAIDRNEVASAADATAAEGRNTIYVTGDRPGCATPRLDLGLRREEAIDYDRAADALREADRVEDEGPSPLGSPMGA